MGVSFLAWEKQIYENVSQCNVCTKKSVWTDWLKNKIDYSTALRVCLYKVMFLETKVNWPCLKVILHLWLYRYSQFGQAWYDWGYSQWDSSLHTFSGKRWGDPWGKSYLNWSEEAKVEKSTCKWMYLELCNVSNFHVVSWTVLYRDFKAAGVTRLSLGVQVWRPDKYLWPSCLHMWDFCSP